MTGGMTGGTTDEAEGMVEVVEGEGVGEVGGVGVEVGVVVIAMMTGRGIEWGTETVELAMEGMTDLVETATAVATILPPPRVLTLPPPSPHRPLPPLPLNERRSSSSPALSPIPPPLPPTPPPNPPSSVKQSLAKRSSLIGRRTPPPPHPLIMEGIARPSAPHLKGGRGYSPPLEWGGGSVEG